MPVGLAACHCPRFAAASCHNSHLSNLFICDTSLPVGKDLIVSHCTAHALCNALSTSLHTSTEQAYAAV
jgi:hypothetical protein